MASNLHPSLDDDVQEAAVARGIARVRGDKSDSWAHDYRGAALHHGLELQAFKNRVVAYANSHQKKIVKAVFKRTGLTLKP